MWLLFGFMAFALAKDEEFLLGDLGVKIQPAGLDMDRWSNWDFLGKSSDGAILLAAWATPFQTPLGEPAAWSPAIEAKLMEYGAREPKRASGSVEAGPNPSVRQEFAFSYPDGAKGTAYSATLLIAGNNFHVATFTRATAAGKAKAMLARTVDTLEVRKPALPTEAGTVEVAGHTLAAPPGFRKPLPDEADGVLAEVNAIGGDDVAACGWLFKPLPAQKPVILLACPSRQHFGVLDALTLEDVAAEIAPRLFGKVAPPPAEMVALPDRNGITWKLPSGGKGVRMALIPTGTAAIRAWIAAPTDAPELDADLNTALTGATWAEPHTVVWTEQVSYYTSYRPFSAQVLCPVTGVLCPTGVLAIGGVMGFAAWSRRKKRSQDLDE